MDKAEELADEIGSFVAFVVMCFYPWFGAIALFFAFISLSVALTKNDEVKSLKKRIEKIEMRNELRRE